MASFALLTTDGQLAASNLEAELAQAERQHRERPGDLSRARQLMERLLTHAQFFGRLSDYDRALALANEAITAAPTSGEAHLLRAGALAALHQFPQALVALDAAQAWQADADKVMRARVGIWQATGKIDRPDLTTFAAEAGAYADKRDFPTAARAFTEAKRHYGDVSPFPVAWLEFQEGHMWEIAGRADRALALYQAAHDRLPGYASASTHLAAIVAAFGDATGLHQAETLLRPLTERSDDPEFVGQLAMVVRQLGRDAEADQLQRRATDAYAALLHRHPEAFADHAARFFLHVAGDARRALPLAEMNLALRPTRDARDLYNDVQHALGAQALAR
jgi:tetratricopeptide (TPR) repeat protein